MWFHRQDANRMIFVVGQFMFALAYTRRAKQELPEP
jgi:hypothetical protein